jgi:hypothetical protein
MLTPTTILARAASWNFTSLAAMFISPEIYLELLVPAPHQPSPDI